MAVGNMDMDREELVEYKVKPEIGSDGQVKNYFWKSADKEIEIKVEEVLIFKAHELPPGTRITIEVPICPKCGEYYACKQLHDCPGCGFNWKDWVDREYLY
jgi:hypothetical protein